MKNLIGKGSKVSIWNVRLAGALSALLLLSLQVSGCAGGAPQKAQSAEVTSSEQVTSVQVVEVKQGRMASALSYSGDVKPKAQVSLSAKGMG
ncbi:MAG: hypothetical protein M1358_15195 [Chloroflexi bacterium]|nr:hypothetical protein [Chloroflexota bacterium]